MPNPPNIDTIRKPIEEQLAQALEAIARIEPDTIDLSNLCFELLLRIHSTQPIFPLVQKLYSLEQILLSHHQVDKTLL
jgi:hypothetical protein